MSGEMRTHKAGLAKERSRRRHARVRRGFRWIDFAAKKRRMMYGVRALPRPYNIRRVYARSKSKMRSNKGAPRGGTIITRNFEWRSLAAR